MKKIGVLVLGLMLSAGIVRAQETPETETVNTPPPENQVVGEQTVSTGKSISGDNGFNPLSVRPVHVSDIMWQKGLLRAMDMREKQNLPMMSKNRELPKFLIKAVEEGDLKPYRNDSLTTPLTIDEFHTNLTIPSQGPTLSREEIEIALANGDSSVLQSAGAAYYSPQHLYYYELKEDMLFDKQRSRLYYDILAVTMYVPSDLGNDLNPSGGIKGIAAFSYKDIVNNVFRNEKYKEAIWFNVQNDREHKNVQDAFDLRLFSSYIIKVSNPYNAMLSEIYGDDATGIKASQWAAFELMEFEHHLWEF